MTVRSATLLFALVLVPGMALSDAAASESAMDESATDEAATDEAATDAAGSGQALAVVKKTLDAALVVAGGEGTRDEKLVSLRGVAADFLDTRAMGRRAIGDVLAAQPPEQQQEYLELFDQLMVRAYLSKLLLFRKPRFGYGKPRRQDDTVIVGTKIITSKDEYLVNYEMREREDRWFATDVIVEGISLTKNYEAQFSSLLRDRSFAELLDLMRRKTRRIREEPT
jgi:phospholipid transport system substrate-binding protein